MKRFLLTLWNDLLGLFYPRLCGACGAPLIDGEELLCLYCLYNLPRRFYHRYPDDENPLRRIFAGCRSVRQVITYLHFEKEGLAQHLIHEFKYHNNDRLAILPTSTSSYPSLSTHGRCGSAATINPSA